MRELLFRGKDIVGNWYAGNLAVIKQDFHNGAGTVKAGSYISNECGSPFAYQIRPETVGQFTGLLDKNGKKIWEGDIVVCRYANEYTPVFQNGIYMAYNPKEMQTIQQPSTQFNIIWRNGCEVIGNIHDNPELLS